MGGAGHAATPKRRRLAAALRRPRILTNLERAVIFQVDETLVAGGRLVRSDPVTVTVDSAAESLCGAASPGRIRALCAIVGKLIPAAPLRCSSCCLRIPRPLSEFGPSGTSGVTTASRCGQTFSAVRSSYAIGGGSEPRVGVGLIPIPITARQSMRLPGSLSRNADGAIEIVGPEEGPLKHRIVENDAVPGEISSHQRRCWDFRCSVNAAM